MVRLDLSGPDLFHIRNDQVSSFETSPGMKLLTYLIVKLYIGTKFPEALLNTPLFSCLYQLPANTLLATFFINV